MRKRFGESCGTLLGGDYNLESDLIPGSVVDWIQRLPNGLRVDGGIASFCRFSPAAPKGVGVGASRFLDIVDIIDAGGLRTVAGAGVARTDLAGARAALPGPSPILAR